ECHALLTIMHEFVESAQVLRDRFARRRTSLGGVEASGVWRYRELVLDVPDAEVVTYPEGNTPFIASAKVATWAEWRGLRREHEGMNPAGSCKDRGMTVGMTQARRVGASAVA